MFLIKKTTETEHSLVLTLHIVVMSQQRTESYQ